MQWTRKLFARWLSALRLSAFFCLLICAAAAKADLTQAQMTAAFLQALKDYAEYSSGEDWAWMTIPSDAELNVDIAAFLDVNGRASGIARYLRQNISDWFYPNFISSVEYQRLTANAATQLASRVSSQLVSKLEDYLDAAAWPSLLSDTSNLGYLSTINGYLYDVYSDLSSLRYLLTDTQHEISTALSVSTNIENNIYTKLDDIKIDLGSVYSKIEDNVDMISQILGEIEADSAYIQIIASDTTDINENTGDILNFLQDELDDFLVSAFAGLTLSAHLDTTNMNVTVENWPSNILTRWDGFVDDVQDMKQLDTTRNSSLSSLLDLVSSIEDTVSHLQTPSSVSVTNEVEVACDYNASLQSSNLVPESGQIQPLTIPALDTSPLDTSSISFPSSAGSPVIVLWENVRLGGFRIPDASVDLGQPQLARAVSVACQIFTTVWWLLYYAALAVLLRREFVYYASLGHTEGAS